MFKIAVELAHYDVSYEDIASHDGHCVWAIVDTQRNLINGRSSCLAASIKSCCVLFRFPSLQVLFVDWQRPHVSSQDGRDWPCSRNTLRSLSIFTGKRVAAAALNRTDGPITELA